MLIPTKDGDWKEVDARSHCPWNYFTNKLNCISLWIAYKLEWNDAYKKYLEFKDQYHWYERFTWNWGRITIRTRFIDYNLDHNQPLCFEEFCMWVAMSYAYKIAL